MYDRTPAAVLAASRVIPAMIASFFLETMSCSFTGALRTPDPDDVRIGVSLTENDGLDANWLGTLI
jgi:hypothetical protein